MEREQIIKALECCLVESNCTGCPLHHQYETDCLKYAGEKALSLIKELIEEIKDLTETVEVRGKVVEKIQIAINEIEEDNRKLTEENERLRAELKQRPPKLIITKKPKGE